MKYADMAAQALILQVGIEMRQIARHHETLVDRYHVGQGRYMKRRIR